MRARFLIVAMTAVTIMGSVSHANKLTLSDERYENIITDIVLPFLEALKNGDVDLIKHYIGSDIYESKSALLERNEEYSEFLRNFYRGVDFYIGKALESGDYIVVHVTIEFLDGDESKAKLYLGKVVDKAPGALEVATWKIVGFISK
jgi:hypothetical protein